MSQNIHVESIAAAVANAVRQSFSEIVTSQNQSAQVSVPTPGTPQYRPTPYQRASEVQSSSARESGSSRRLPPPSMFGRSKKGRKNQRKGPRILSYVRDIMLLS